MPTTLQTLVADFLAKQKPKEFALPAAEEDIGCFEFYEGADEASALLEFNAYRVGEESAKTAAGSVMAPLEDEDVDDEDAGETLVHAQPVTAECEAALQTCSWRNNEWYTALLCPTDIIGRVMGREREFVEELTSAYLGLRIVTKRTGDAGMANSLANPVEKSKGSSKRDRLHLSSGAVLIEMTHDSDKVELAKARVEMVERVQEFRKFAAYTHFLSLPILDEDNLEFPARHRVFRKLLDDLELVDVNSELCPPLGGLHITLLMLRLYSEEDVEAVVKVLKRVTSKPSAHRILFTDEVPPEKPKGVQLPPKGFNIHLQGLKTMEEIPTETRVLYTFEDGSAVDQAPLELRHQESPELERADWLTIRRPAESYLNSLVEDIVSEMIQAGLVEAEELIQDRLIKPDGSIQRKLHVTIINSKLQRHHHQTFDATPILEKYADFDFGTAVITGLHISRRAKASPGTAYYTPEFVLPIRPHLGL